MVFTTANTVFTSAASTFKPFYDSSKAKSGMRWMNCCLGEAWGGGLVDFKWFFNFFRLKFGLKKLFINFDIVLSYLILFFKFG